MLQACLGSPGSWPQIPGVASTALKGEGRSVPRGTGRDEASGCPGALGRSEGVGPLARGCGWLWPPTLAPSWNNPENHTDV